MVGGILWWLHARRYESTDDAFIDGHVVAISPRVSAVVRAVFVDDNVAVRPGDLLVELDRRDFATALQQARANAASARAKLASARAMLRAKDAAVAEAEAEVTVARTTAENAERDYRRYAHVDARARSAQQLDAARAAFESAGARLAQARASVTAARAEVADAATAILVARAGVERARADVRRARLDLSYCTIRAPVEGRITKKDVEPGAYVATGQDLLAIVSTDVWVTANFKETQLDRMRPGEPVTIDVDAYPDASFSGRVASIQHGTGARFSVLPAENATGNYVKVVQRVPVKIVFDGDQIGRFDRVLAPGMSVVPSVEVR